MRSVALSVALVAAAAGANAADDQPVFKATEVTAPFVEQFTDDWSERWTPSEATKKTPVGGETFSYVGEWKVEDPQTPLITGKKALVAKSKAAHHAISAPFASPVDFKTKPLVVQYEVQYQKGGNCGGGYIKLLEDGFQTSGKEFSDTTPWVIMFGPDLTCPGNKIHFIFRHKNPVTGEYEEKHLSVPPKPTFGKDTNIYTLIVNPDNTYEVQFNGKVEKSGNLLEDFTPPVNPPKEIDDPEDSKPAEWVDTKKIPDPEAVKPEDWDESEPYEVPDKDAVKPEGWLDDEPENVADPDAEKPEEWDDEEDGDWIAPTVRNPACDEAPGCGEWKRPFKANPKYKGKWYAPMIDNPEYKGEWAPRRIENPGFFEDLEPVKHLNKIGGVGIELWTMTEDILFDNIYVGHSVQDAEALREETWGVKHALEEDSKATPDIAKNVEIPEFSADPAGFVRAKIGLFLDDAREDPISAVKSHVDTAAGLVTVIATFFALLFALFGLVGAGQKPIPKGPSAKKTDAPTPDDKKEEKAPVAPAGGEKKEETPLKKRKTDAPTPDDKKEKAPVAPAGGEKKEETPLKKHK